MDDYLTQLYLENMRLLPKLSPIKTPPKRWMTSPDLDAKIEKAVRSYEDIMKRRPQLPCSTVQSRVT